MSLAILGKKIIHYEPLSVYFHALDQCPGRIVVVPNHCYDMFDFFDNNAFWLNKILRYYRLYMNGVFGCDNFEMFTQRHRTGETVFEVIPRHDNVININGYRYKDPGTEYYDPNINHSIMPYDEYQEYMIRNFITWRYHNDRNDDMVIGSSSDSDEEPWVCRYID